jgi:hypothetical protein
MARQKILARLTFPAVYVGDRVTVFDAAGESATVIGSNGDRYGLYGESRVIVEFPDGERMAVGRDEFAHTESLGSLPS